MSAHKKQQVNLLPEKGFTSTTTGRVLTWILSTFRIIVIVTEIIVMIAFLSRFWLDAQNTDLSEEIEQKKAILVASADFEKEFRQTQERLQIYSGLTLNKVQNSSVISQITKLVPDDTILKAIHITGNVWVIDAKTANEISIQQFAVNIDSIENTEKVSITQLSSDNEDPDTLVFKLKFEIKDKTNAKKENS
ncbi:hypothetical protein A2685_03055 [Candidatus Woesebacteria bacterium RIFCSPHIGHO2_01_FULL_37_10]|uniref:Uncharacterized protein n=1 Tax=Candidatus Woesebacteria bacterium RIFCSPHIGHO2_01_FULL_37_10 TaxID=1802489 RepID=A0A1F7XUK0_9BACT|nr:MAG: hypothetical protein A2685_03055 [Candidatus Woesebacteria bacterium RIFCSPHIGHO2_01_FULL_37_10]